MTSVAFPGPPPVKTWIVSKILLASIARSISAMMISGTSMGSSIWRRICQRDAPSSVAASIGALGTAESPASMINMIKGVHSQMSMIIKAPNAVTGPEKTLVSSNSPIRLR